MVQIIGFAERKSADGREFCTLIVKGGVEMVQSKTGSYYATARTASVPSTFDADFCKDLLGSKLPGEVKRIVVDPYEYVNPDTGEQIELAHSYVYIPTEEAAIL